jgi:hypothetical protein
VQVGQIRHCPLTLYDRSRSRLTVFLPHNMIIASGCPRDQQALTCPSPAKITEMLLP